MAKPLIRQLATSYDGSIIAAGEFNRKVHIWNIHDGAKVAVFDTVLDFGGRRLAISRDGRTCITGTYHGQYLSESRVSGGAIAAYSTSDGRRIWENKRIKRIQGINFSFHESGKLYATFDDQPCRIISCSSGEEIEKIRGVRWIEDSPLDSTRFVATDSGYSLVNSETCKAVGKLEKFRFSFLDVAFSRDRIVIAEVGGPITCFDTRNCSRVWQHVPDEGHHFLRTRFNERTKEMVGVDWPYEHGGPKRLICLDASSGVVNRQLALKEDSWDMEFAMQGKVLITSDGRIIDTSSGEETDKLSFSMVSDDEWDAMWKEKRKETPE